MGSLAQKALHLYWVLYFDGTIWSIDGVEFLNVYYMEVIQVFIFSQVI